MAQHAILRFEKHKGNPARPLEAHHERQKEKYASNPDIDTAKSKHNFHIVKPEGRYYHFIQNRIEQAGCRTRKDSTRFVDTLITASPEFFTAILSAWYLQVYTLSVYCGLWRSKRFDLHSPQ